MEGCGSLFNRNQPKLLRAMQTVALYIGQQITRQDAIASRKH
jgi:hypothetical protein